MMNFLIAVWIFLPAGLANMAPVIANNIPILKKFTQPLDGYKKFRNKRIFGDHKTVRGLLSGIMMGLFIAIFQVLVFKLVNWPGNNLSPVDYGSLQTVVLGGLLGFGAILGDAVKSFFKRQAGIEPGKNWFFFDQSDYVIGAIFVSLPFFTLSTTTYFLLLILGLILHPVINVLSWVLRLQDNPL